MDMDDNATLAVVVARLEDLRQDLHDLRDELKRAREDNVSRNEWMQRNLTVDSKFDAQGREISDLKQLEASKRAPWPVYLAVVVSSLAMAWQVVSFLLNQK